MSEQSSSLGNAESAWLRDNARAVADFITRAQRLSAPQWVSPRAAGKWAPYHEALHLALSYRFFTEAVAARLELAMQISPERSQQLHAAVMPKLRAGEPLPTGARSPAEADPTARADSPNEDRDAILEELATAGRMFCAALADAASAAPPRQVRHPYFGYLSMDDFGLVAAAHTRHHMRFLPEPLAPAG